MVYNHRRRIISLTPDELFSHYTELLPLLSPNALPWSFSLVLLFSILCLSSYRKQCDSGAIFLPDLSRLFTSLLQKLALQIVCEHVVTTFKFLTEENRRICGITTLFNYVCGSSQNVLDDYHHSSSNAEKIIQRVNFHRSSSNTE